MNLLFETPELRESVFTICRDVEKAGGRALLVGGCVRDAVLGIASKDIDIEVFRLSPEQLLNQLKQHFSVNCVGQAFGVIKINKWPIDVSIPRRESKQGMGHKGFEVFSDPRLSYQEAASRRDFTINAMAFDPLTDDIIDPFNGMEDLDQRILRHTTGKFAEDPLRVLRGMQFAARFELNIAPETVELCQTITPEGLAHERIFDEWTKLILSGVKPSLGLQFLRDCGWIQYYPELRALIDCPQDPRWHPEGDVWNHTLHSMDAFARERVQDDLEDLIVGMAVLCHDFGKPATTQQDEHHIHAHGHDKAGVAPARTFLERMTHQDSLIEAVLSLVAHHMRPHELFTNKASDSAIRRLAHKVDRIDRLIRVDRADRLGRSPDGDTDQACGEWLLARAKALEVTDSAPKPFVLGRHLIQLGCQPGPEFSPLLAACYEAQLEGQITDEQSGIAFVKQII